MKYPPHPSHGPLPSPLATDAAETMKGQVPTWEKELKRTGQRNDLETKLAEGKKGRVPRWERGAYVRFLRAQADKLARMS